MPTDVLNLLLWLASIVGLGDSPFFPPGLLEIDFATNCSAWSTHFTASIWLWLKIGIFCWFVIWLKWPGGVVVSTFASHAEDRGSIPSGDRFGRMQGAHRTMVWMVVVLIRAAKITRVHMSGVASRLCCRETCTERTVAAPQKKRRSAPRS